MPPAIESATGQPATGSQPVCNPDLDIIIVSWNTREFLVKCLQSLQAALEPASGDSRRLAGSPYRVRVMVVDNASSDHTAQMVRQDFSWVHLIENRENLGFAHANNQAIRESCGRFVLLLNCDTVMHPGTLETLVTFLDTHPSAGAAGARLLNPDGSVQPACHPMLTPWREFWRLSFLDNVIRKSTYGARIWKATAPLQVEVIKGACLLLRRQALDQVGLLDESYFMYTEEVDLCYRLAQAGWELWWVPQAVVVHHGEGSTRQVAEQMYVQLYRSKVQFYRKFGGAEQANRYKRLLRLAYGSRLAATRLVAPLSSSSAMRARTFGRLLAELPGM